MLTEWTMLYSNLVCKAVEALKDGRAVDAQDIVSFIEKQPLPPFAELIRTIKLATAHTNDNHLEFIDELRRLLTPAIQAQPFDENYYIQRYPDEAAAIEKHVVKFVNFRLCESRIF